MDLNEGRESGPGQADSRGRSGVSEAVPPPVFGESRQRGVSIYYAIMNIEIFGWLSASGSFTEVAITFLDGELISCKEAAQRKHVTVQTIRRHVALGHLRTFRGWLFR